MAFRIGPRSIGSEVTEVKRSTALANIPLSRRKTLTSLTRLNMRGVPCGGAFIANNLENAAIYLDMSK